MCGRFTQMYSWRELYELYSIHDRPKSNHEPNYNVAPTQAIDIVLPDVGGVQLGRARWGLVPTWWKKELKAVPATFNARAETVASKPMFRSAFKTRRCVIPASGFYEWTGPKGARQPHYITRVDGEPMSLAGLWETWRNPETGEDMLSATIIVCSANEWMSAIHDRMPVILEQDDIDAWLNEPNEDLLRPAPEGLLQEWQVNPQVNSSRYTGEDAMAPIVAA